jgi:large subunit ribosomal protein L25
MSSQITLKVSPRTLVSKGQIKALRKTGVIPAVVYGKKGTFPVSVDFKALPKGHTKSAMITLDVEGKHRSVLMKEVQVNPITDLPLHIDFHEVEGSDVVKVYVPLEFVGLTREQEKEGSFKILLRSIEVAGKAASLPLSLKVNVGQLKVDESAHLTDVEMPTDLKVFAQKSLALASLVKL